MASLRQRIEELEQSESVRKREEETLRENEDKYRIIFESINDAVFVHDLDEEGLPGRFLQVNDVACHRLGYTREELLTLTPRDITVPEEYERIAGKRIGLASQGNILVETIHLTKNGRKIPVESNIRQFQYLDRQAALSISRDITERKQAEETLQRLEEKFFQAFQANPSLMAIRSREDGRFINVNEAYIRVTGYSQEELIGSNSIALGITESASYESVRETFNKQGFIRNQEVKIRTKTGDIHTGLFSAVSIEIEDEPCILSAFQDITARKQAEEKLREAHRRLDEIIEFLPDATFVIDADSKVIAWNRAMEQMTGVPKAEMIGKGEYEYTLPFYGERRPILIDLALLPDAEFEKRRYDIAQRSADTIYGEVYVPKTYGGKGAYLYAAASRLHDATGSIVGP